MALQINLNDEKTGAEYPGVYARITGYRGNKTALKDLSVAGLYDDLKMREGFQGGTDV